MATLEFDKMDIQTEQGFKHFYKSHYAKLMRFANYYTQCEEDAENIVQDVFLYLWEKKGLSEDKVILASFLFTMVKNRCLDYLKHKKVEQEYRLKVETSSLEMQFKLASLQAWDHDTLDEEEIQQLLYAALEQLSPRCREIFIKGKLEGMKYKEIALQMNISEKTVDNQIQIATKKLSMILKENPLLLLFLFT